MSGRRLRPARAASKRARRAAQSSTRKSGPRTTGGRTRRTPARPSKTSRPAPGGSAAPIVGSTLRQYADRGVFRGLSEARGPGGRVEYHFTWLTSRVIRLRFDPRHNTVSFHDLLPSVDRTLPLIKDVAGLIGGRTSAALPAHKRLDGRRASVRGRLRGGAFSLTLAIRPGQHEYATRYALNLINDLFVLLGERYPDYLVEYFGVSGE